MNLTEQERADRVVRESEELRRAAFEAIPTMCFVVDEAGRLVAVNAFGARSLCYSADELLGQPWLELFYEPDRNAVRAHAEDCFREVGRVTHWEARKARRDGQSMQVRETGRTVLVNDRAMLFISSEDVTERRRVEEALRQSERYLAEAQRLAHTGSWTANHVTGITTHYSDETFRLFGLDPRRGYVPQLDEILQLMHPEDRERITEEYEQIVRDKAEYAQDFRIVLHDGTIRHLQSIEAMSGIEERRRLLTILSTAQGPETVRVEVRDSGTGLDPEHATRVFESFYTTKPEGLGIGLSISRTIVEAHGGRLGSGANTPHGAMFWFMLPVKESLT